MPYIVVIFGASGSGKSTLLEYLLRAGKQYAIHMKGTSRAARQYDGVEIQCKNEINRAEYDYIYQTYGCSYGIQKSQIDKAIKQNQHHFIICNDISTIQSLKRDYGKYLKVIFYTFDAPREALKQIQTSRGISDDEIELRLAKTSALYRSYIENSTLFDAILQNKYGEDLSTTLKTKMENILSDFAKAEQSSPSPKVLERLEKFTKELEARLSDKKDRMTTVTEPRYVFVIMAMPEDDPDMEDVHQTIKRTCKELEYKAERVDDIQFTGKISEKIQSCIKLSELVVADLTYERPNVYYEVGFADAYEKPLLLVARKGTKVHFDLQGNKVLFYRNMTELEKLLSKAIKGLVTYQHRKLGSRLD